MDPYITFVLCVWGIVWSIYGTVMWLQLGCIAPTWRWRVFLFLAAGPCVYAIGLYRGYRAARHWVLHRLGLPACDCCQ